MKFEDTIGPLVGARHGSRCPPPRAPSSRAASGLLARILSITQDWCSPGVANWVICPARPSSRPPASNHAYLFMFPCDLSNPSVGSSSVTPPDHVFILGHSNGLFLGYVRTRGIRHGGMLAGLTFGERVQDYFGKRAGPF